MKIYYVNRLLASESKSKIITHFWHCTCKNHNLTHLIKKLKINQSNLSKHISVLLKENVLDYEKIKKDRFYFINKEWKKKWQAIVEPQIENKENKKYICNCHICGGKNEKSNKI